MDIRTWGKCQVRIALIETIKAEEHANKKKLKAELGIEWNQLYPDIVKVCLNTTDTEILAMWKKKEKGCFILPFNIL